MSHTDRIPERDWKAMRCHHDASLGRLCDRIPTGARGFTEGETSTSHDRHLW